MENLAKSARDYADLAHGLKARHFAEVLPTGTPFETAIELSVEIRRQNKLRAKRYAYHVDPLISARTLRPSRTPSAKAAAATTAQLQRDKRNADFRKLQAHIEKIESTRASLIRAARVARAIGFKVRASKGRSGRISSYYATRGGETLRISDHEIPTSLQRESNARYRGRFSYDGFAGAELLIDGERSGTWLRRAIQLTAAG
jgi:hypothetical protein